MLSRVVRNTPCNRGLLIAAVLPGQHADHGGRGHGENHHNDPQHHRVGDKPAQAQPEQHRQSHQPQGGQGVDSGGAQHPAQGLLGNGDADDQQGSGVVILPMVATVSVSTWGSFQPVSASTMASRLATRQGLTKVAPFQLQLARLPAPPGAVPGQQPHAKGVENGIKGDIDHRVVEHRLVAEDGLDATGKPIKPQLEKISMHI